MPVEQRGQVIAVEHGPTGSNREEPEGSAGRRQPSRGDTSRMNREVQVRICEGLGAKLPGPTRHRFLATVIPLDTRGTSTYSTFLDDSSEPIPNDSTMRVAAPLRSAIIEAAELISLNQGILTDPQQQTINLLQSNHDDEVVPKL